MRGQSLTIALAVCAAALACAPPAAAQKGEGGRVALPRDPPMPPARPKGVDRRSSEPSDAGRRPVNPAEVERPRAELDKSEQETAEAAECRAALEKIGADFSPVAKAGEGACAIDNPVSFKGVRTKDGRVSLDAAVTLRCAMAKELAGWIAEDLTAVLKKHNLTLVRLSAVGGHECRARNGQASGAPSEHSVGNAFDVRFLEAAGGVKIDLMQDREDTRRALRQDVRDAACARFTTVLGSGSDANHEDHLHVDLRGRRGGRRLCQWEVR